MVYKSTKANVNCKLDMRSKQHHGGPGKLTPRGQVHVSAHTHQSISGCQGRVQVTKNSLNAKLWEKISHLSNLLASDWFFNNVRK